MAKRISHKESLCSVARPLDAIGDWWSLLIRSCGPQAGASHTGRPVDRRGRYGRAHAARLDPMFAP